MTVDLVWLNQRRKGIGGSDVAAILGLSPWRSAFDVWLDKLGLYESVEQTPEMSYGLLVEPVIRQWYSNETGRTVYLPAKILQHPEHPFMLASLDGLTDDERVLEIKTARSSSDWGDPGTDQIPVYYQTQAQHYLCVTGLDACDVVVSFAGTMPLIYTVEADSEAHEMLIDAEAEFWALVESQTPPEPVTYSDMVSRFKTSTATQIRASEEIMEALGLLKLINTDMKTWGMECERLKADIMKFMGANDTLVDSTGKLLVKWKQGRDGVRRFLPK